MTERLGEEGSPSFLEANRGVRRGRDEGCSGVGAARAVEERASVMRRGEEGIFIVVAREDGTVIIKGLKVEPGDEVELWYQRVDQRQCVWMVCVCSAR